MGQRRGGVVERHHVGDQVVDGDRAARQELLDGRRAYLEHLRDRAQARVAALLAAEVTP